MAHFAFDAIGTTWQIECAVPQEGAARVKSSILCRIDEFDQTYSRFRDDSLVTKMSRSSGTFALPADARAMIDFYRQMYDITSGSVTPLIGQTLSDAGYDAAYRLQPKELHRPPSWDSVMKFDNTSVTVKSPLLLDFGAAGKGYLVDLIAELLRKEGVKSFVINAGGDIRHEDPSMSVSVGLEDPDDISLAVGIVELNNQSLCGSAGNKRTWSGYTHIIDPQNLRSPQHIKAVWTVADSTMLADGMSTCMYFVPAEHLQTVFEFEYAVMLSDGMIQHSEKFPSEFFPG